MYFVTNRVKVFLTSKFEKSIAVIFEESNFTGQTSLFLLEREQLKNLCYIESGEDKAPMPYFADIIYALINRKYSGLSFSCEPDVNRIVIFSDHNQIELTYQESNDEYRILFSEYLKGVAEDVYDTLKGLGLRVVSFALYTHPEEGASKAVKEEPVEETLESLDESELTVEEPEEGEGESSLLGAVSELEKQYVEAKDEVSE